MDTVTIPAEPQPYTRYDHSALLALCDELRCLPGGPYRARVAYDASADPARPWHLTMDGVESVRGTATEIETRIRRALRKGGWKGF